MSRKILNSSQAQAVYAAMCALNNVGGKIDRIYLQGGQIRVHEDTTGRIFVDSKLDGEEFYISQVGFAAAYGLS